MLFAEVIGQDKVKDQLRTSVQAGRIPHAQLFFGANGSGTLPMAIAYARYVSCNSRSSADSCTSCPSCIKIAKLQHPDLHFSFPVNASKKISNDHLVSDDYIQEWREFTLQNPYFSSTQWYDFIGLENKQGIINKYESESILRKLSFKSFESDYKFMVIWLPEKMNSTSANMLLKLVEEPPEKTIFLLVSEEPAQVLTTITSRTQPVKLPAIEIDSLQKFLKKNNGLTEEAATEISRLSEGSCIVALEVLQSSASRDYNLDSFIRIMQLCWGNKYLEINDWVDEMAALGREKIKLFFDYALRLTRENLVLHLNRSEISYLTSAESKFSANFHPFINGRNVTRIYEEMNRASADIERNGYSKYILFDFALNINQVIKA